MGRRNDFRLKGSFTVEASLLMGIVLMILVALIYASFFVHDNAVIQGITCELAAMGSNLAQEQNGTQQIESRKKMLITSRFLNTKNVKVSVSMNDEQIIVSGGGKFPVPGFIMKLFNNNALEIQKSWRREIYDPADMIRKIRGLEYMVDGIKG